ncbi:MAG TPA: sugar phosphate isomerase/epimerase [Tepidisphaeraceae bacterium]|nr:sugar phosphate isomerase/epimerase [Tepidisphaeraceae bacterium]
MSTHPAAPNTFDRRTLLTGALATAGALALPNFTRAADAPAAKPNSNIHGVKIGAITYSYRNARIDSAEQTLKALLESGLSEVELMGGPIQSFAGITAPKKGEPAKKFTDAEREAQLVKCAELKKMYNDAGVNIHIQKMAFGASDEEIEFNFRVAKALGAVAITTERNEALAKRAAPFAEKHDVAIAFHNHTNNLPSMDKPDPILDISPKVMFNLDVGHYFAGTKGQSPVPVIEKYHARIVSLHLKDRTADGRNLSWGKGGTPLKEVLQLLKKEKWPIYGDIEVEYPIPEGSNPVKEVAICLQYCREALA